MRENELCDDRLLEDMFSYKKCISIFVFNEKLYFVLDMKENFLLNMKLDLDIELKKGNLSLDDYKDNLSSNYYRNGIWQLTKHNFLEYIKSKIVTICSIENLREMLFCKFHREECIRLYSVVEGQLSYAIPISDLGSNSDFYKINKIASRLPLFYINFDTNTYLHMDWEHCHEDYAYDDWFSKAKDFGYLIPDEFCYWKIEGRDYWKFKQI